MITDDPEKFVSAFQETKNKVSPERSTMKAALLVDPSGLAVSSESATDNVYMDIAKSIDVEKAHEQHQSVSRKIRELGVPVISFTGVKGQDDGVFPNNVFATSHGNLIVGNMFHPVRQKEATRLDIRDFFTNSLNYDLEDLSQKNGVAELTGSLAIDRVHNISLCGMSNRCTAEGSENMHKAFGHALTFQFELVETEYHTNLVLAVLAGRACVIHPDSFKNKKAAEAIWKAYGGQTVEITTEEKNAFVGNCISITEHDVLFSETSVNAMNDSTRAKLESLGFNIHSCKIDELEKAGGSLRCLIAEVFD